MEDVENLYHGLVFLLDPDYYRVKCMHFVDNFLKRKSQWLFKFVTDPDVEPTNNRAERALWPSVMYRKRNGGTGSESGDRVYERIYSLHYTSKLKKSSILMDGPPEIKKWMDKRLNRSRKTTGPAS